MTDKGKHPNDETITVETVRGAITLGEWALEHAIVALSNADESDPEAIRVWRWVTRRNDTGAEFSARHAFDNSRERDGRMEATVEGLGALVKRGYLRQLPQPTGNPGRPPSPRYMPNPNALRAR
jgi:hypothetical protein